MSAATQGRVGAVQYGPGLPVPQFVVLPVKAAAKIYQGTLVAVDSTGYAIPASAALGQRILGVAAGPGNTGTDGDVDNTTGANGALTVRVKQGAFFFGNNGSSIAKTDVGKPCYAATDSDVDISDGAGLRPFAGIITGVDSLLGTLSLGVCVLVGLIPTLSGADEALALSFVTSYRARAVATQAFAAYTSVAGVITANANGAFATTVDGVTIAVGDLVFLPEGIAAAAKDAGPYIVTSLGGASSKFVFTRPDWWATGSLIQQGIEIQIGGEGTLFKATKWKSFVTTALKQVDTDAPVMWPDATFQSLALVAGTKTITNTPIRSATETGVFIHRNIANTSTATTGGYHPTVGGANGKTVGVLGTASLVIEATVAAGTINAADVSTVLVEIRNWG